MTSLPLWRERDFRRLWIAQAVSDFGARITREGLPMMAVMSLAASPAQLGVLAAFSRAPTLLAGLSTGGLVDSRRRRPILVFCDLVRAVVLAALPAAALLHRLAIWQAYAAAAVVAGASAVFDIADHAYLPSLVSRERVTEANARIATTESLAELGGPALAGALFQWLTAPIAVAANALTYLASAAFLARIEAAEPEPAPRPRARRLFAGLRTGLATAWAEPLVRPLLLIAGVGGLFGGIFSALYMLFALRILGLAPALLGLVIAVGGASALAGSLIARPLGDGLGTGPAIIASGVISGASSLLIPLAEGSRAPALYLIGAQLFGDSFGVATIILSVSLRQTLIAPHLLGRTGAAFQALAGGGALLGALAGGWMGETLGVGAALLVGAIGVGTAPLLALGSPLRKFRNIPAASTT